MKQVLDYLNLTALGEVMQKPIEEFSGKLVAKATRRGTSDQWIAVKWNPTTLAPDISFDPHVSSGNISSIDEVYANPTEAGEEAKEVAKPTEPTEFDRMTIPLIKAELTGEFQVDGKIFVGKNKQFLYDMLVELRAEKADDEKQE